MTDLLLGVDGGGSKTRALLADRSGVLLGAGTAGSSNYQAVGFAAAVAALQEAIAAAFHDAGRMGQAAVACMGLAGAGRPDDRAHFEKWAAQQGFARRWAIVGDAELVLAAGTPAGWGVALICGTGSIGYARTPDGRSARAGGWGYLLGDEGSGYAIGRAALGAVSRAADGRSPRTALSERLLAATRSEKFDDLVRWAAGASPAEVAALAPQVLAIADTGDPLAQGIADYAARELTQLAVCLLPVMNVDPPVPVAVTGGLLGNDGPLRRSVVARLREEPRLAPVEGPVDAVLGAVRLAATVGG